MNPRSKSATSKSALSRSAIRKPSSSKAAAESKSPRKTAAKVGQLPEWNLSDLYSGIDAPEVGHDLEKMDSECVGFETEYKGKLAVQAAQDSGGKWLAEAGRRYEAIDDLAGGLGFFAGVVHGGASLDRGFPKFYGDVSDRLTAAWLRLVFFALELNRIDDAVSEHAMQTPELANYRPWIKFLGRDKPYQLEDRVEQLF